MYYSWVLQSFASRDLQVIYILFCLGYEKMDVQYTTGPANK